MIRLNFFIKIKHLFIYWRRIDISYIIFIIVNFISNFGIQRRNFWILTHRTISIVIIMLHIQVEMPKLNSKYRLMWQMQMA